MIVSATNGRLTTRDNEFKAWKNISGKKQEDMSNRKAKNAGQIDMMDQSIGRIFTKLMEEHQLDNTLIFYLNDNGACAK